VKLTLVNDETKQQVGQVVSKNGDYKFENVFPGKYSISAEHSSWTFVKVRDASNF
jgi:protocatechuate 3,4-dioxygenase beta subunit